MTGAGAVEPQSSMVESLAGEMVGRWGRGERPTAEEYLGRFPELLRSPAALELIAEELALRQEFGLPISADELIARFPAWQVQVSTGGLHSVPAFEELDFPFVPLGGSPRWECAQVAALPGLWIGLPRIQAVLARLELANHDHSSRG